MQMFEVAEKVEFFLQRRGSCASVCFRRERINAALPVNAHRGHLADRRIKSTGLASGGIFRVIDALQCEKKNESHHGFAPELARFYQRKPRNPPQKRVFTKSRQY